jgi:uncharacterized protein (UPF0335 family)
MGGGESKDEQKDNNRKDRATTDLSTANTYATKIKTSSGNIDGYITDSTNTAADALKYASDINAYVTSLDDAIDNAGTQYEIDDYNEIKNIIIPYQTAANAAATAANLPHETIRSNSTIAKNLIEPTDNALDMATTAKNELYKLKTYDNVEDKQRNATVTRVNADFINNLYDTGIALLDIKGVSNYEQQAKDAKTIVDSKKGESNTQKELATTEYNRYTKLKSNYSDSAWLIAEIERNQDNKKKAETKKKDIDDPELSNDTDAKTSKEDELLAAIDDMKKSKLGGTAFDKKEAELVELTLEKENCAKTQANHVEIGRIYDASMAAINTQGLIDRIGSKKIQEDAAKELVRLSKQKIIDLSGDIIDLSGDILNIKNKISQDELTTEQLNKYIGLLNNKIIDLTEKNYSNKVYNNQNLLNLNENVDQDLRYIFSDLKTQNINPKLLNTKIKYREIEEEKLLNTNKVLDILFYCFYGAFIIINIVTRNIKMEHFLIYILIGLIPFVYPFLFKNIKNIMHIFHLDGNKYAFIENENTFDSYNI